MGPETANDTLTVQTHQDGPAEQNAPPAPDTATTDRRKEQTENAPIAATPAPSTAETETPVRSVSSTSRPQRQLQQAPVNLGGLVVDETMSPQGRTFYADFYRVWRSPPTNGFYTVRIEENPTPGRGTLVQVFVNDDVTFQARLQPQTHIAEQALQAARRTYAYVRSGQGILRIY